MSRWLAFLAGALIAAPGADPAAAAHATFGLSVWVTESIALDFSYYKAFENTGTGPFLAPGAPAGSYATNSLSEDAISIGFTFDTK